MKIHRSILAAGLLALTGSAALALTVPVQQDSTATNGKFVAGAGKAVTLSVNSKQIAYVQFNLFDPSTVPSAIQPGNITSANLRIYVGKAKVPGDLQIHAVTGSWNEAETGPAPAIDGTVIATIPAAQVATKDFVVVDVTNVIEATLAGASNNGFAITAAGATKVTLGAKEGPATGYPCELDIETNYANDGSGNTTFTTVNADTVNANNFDAGQFTASNDFGSLFLFGGFQGTAQNAGTTLMGSFTGTNAGPQLRFQNSASVDQSFTDIGQDADENFVIQRNDDAQFTVTKDGSVGVGTSSPGAKLDVRGDVKLGSSGQLFATAGQENLRIVRGFVNGNATVGIGAGTFTVARTQGAPTGDYTVTYSPAFGDTAVVALSPFTGGATNITFSLLTETSTTFRVQFFAAGNPADEAFTFIAAGAK